MYFVILAIFVYLYLTVSSDEVEDHFKFARIFENFKYMYDVVSKKIALEHLHSIYIYNKNIVIVL